MWRSRATVGAAFILVLVLGGCGERWEGVVYPSRSDPTRSIYVGEFRSLEECRAGVMAALETRGIPVYRADYECGLNCKTPDGFTVRVCQRTEH